MTGSMSPKPVPFGTIEGDPEGPPYQPVFLTLPPELTPRVDWGAFPLRTCVCSTAQVMLIDCHPHFIDKETEAQGDLETF